MSKIINTQEFNEILKSEGLVAVDFFATWCGPCKMLAPVLDKVGEELADKIKIYKIDIDQEESLAMEYQIRTVPTVIFFKNGEIVDKLIGVISKDELVNKINSL